MMAMSVSGSRIESGCSLRLTGRGMMELLRSSITLCSAFCNTMAGVIDVSGAGKDYVVISII
jgi:hypothetical protein